MKKYIKSSLSVYNPADVDEIIKNFDPYVKTAKYDSTYVVDALIEDRNSDFSEWIRCWFDTDYYMTDISWLDDPDNEDIKRIMWDTMVEEKIDNALYEAENLL